MSVKAAPTPAIQSMASGEGRDRKKETEANVQKHTRAGYKQTVLNGDRAQQFFSPNVSPVTLN